MMAAITTTIESPQKACEGVFKKHKCHFKNLSTCEKDNKTHVFATKCLRCNLVDRSNPERSFCGGCVGGTISFEAMQAVIKAIKTYEMAINQISVKTQLTASTELDPILSTESRIASLQRENVNLKKELQKIRRELQQAKQNTEHWKELATLKENRSPKSSGKRVRFANQNSINS